MPSESSDGTQILLGVIADLRSDITRVHDKVDQTHSAISEVKGEQIAQGIKLEQVLRQATLTNGRVSDLEQRNLSADGYAAGRKAERARLFMVGKVITKPATWAWTTAAAAVAYVAKDKAG